MMGNESQGGVGIEIYKIKEIAGQLEFTSVFTRRINEDYIVPRKCFNDSYVKNEGLYPCSIVPHYYNGRELIVVYEAKIIQAVPGHLDELFNENIRGFKQTVAERHQIPRKGRLYYSESEWTHDTSPEGLYTTLIFPSWLVGKVVTLMDSKKLKFKFFSDNH